MNKSSWMPVRQHLHRTNGTRGKDHRRRRTVRCAGKRHTRRTELHRTTSTKRGKLCCYCSCWQVCATVPMCSVPMLEGSAINEQRSFSQCMCWMLCGVRCQYSLCEMGKSTGVIDTNLALQRLPVWCVPWGRLRNGRGGRRRVVVVPLASRLGSENFGREVCTVPG